MKVREIEFNHNEYLKKYYSNSNKLMTVQLDLTYRCNANCFFCYQKNFICKEQELTLSEVYKLIDDLSIMGVYNIGFVGGEPLMRNDIFEIIEYTQSKGISVSMITNGHLLDEDKIKKFQKLMIDNITISFHSSHKDSYTKHFGVSQIIFDKTIENIKKMIDLNISLGISITITKDNLGTLMETIHFLESIGIDRRRIGLNLLLESGDTNIDSYRITQKKYRDLQKILDSKSFNKLHEVPKGMCTAGRIFCNIGPTGDIMPCPFLNVRVGNIREDSIFNIWNNNDYLNEIRKLKVNDFLKCSDCKIKDKCKKCIGSNYNETKCYTLPSQSYCDMNKLFVKVMEGEI